MADEQIIYLSPEEEVTSVRERLERTHAQHIIFIIPAQTHLRNLSAWRLLAKRAQELGKDIHVISADRQIQSLVKTAGLRVADSLASLPSGQAASTSPRTRSDRPGSGMRGRNGPQSRVPPGGSYARQRTGEFRQRPPAGRQFGAATSTDAGQDRYREQANFGAPFHPPPDDAPGREDGEPPNAYQGTGMPFGPHYDFEVGSSARYSATPYDEDEDEDPLQGHINQAQSIRQAAQSGNAEARRAQAEQKADVDEPGTTDPLAFDEAELRQHPASSYEEPLSRARDTMSPPPVGTRSHRRRRSDAGRARNPATPPFSGIFGAAPGNQRERASQRAEADAAPALGRNSQVGPKAVSLPLAGNAGAQSATQRPAERAQSNRPGGVGKARGRRLPQLRANKLEMPLLIGLLVLFLLGLLAYFAPAADVVVTVATQDFAVPTTLTAGAASQPNVALHTLPAQELTYDTSIKGNGPVTGSSQVGFKSASGNVVFSNNSGTPITIPSGIIITTTNDVQFATTAETLVGRNNQLLTPVQAQAAGSSGNVGPNSVTVIPPASFTQIQSANTGVTLNPGELSVTNSSGFSGGGAGTVPAVASADVSAEQAALDQKLHPRIQAWLKQHTRAGDALGKPVITEVATPTPAVGMPAQNGFTETLSLHLSVLVVRAAALQQAATAQFRLALRKQLPGLALLPQQQVHVIGLQSSSPNDGSSLKLSFIASGKVARPIAEDAVRNLVAGRSVAEAQQNLRASSLGGILGVSIVVHPAFIPWTPFYSRRINVAFLAGTAKNSPPPRHPGQRITP